MPQSRESQWYVAELVLEYSIEGADASLVHINTLLISAASPEAAFTKANELGRSHRANYLNPDGKAVAVDFVGLRELFYVYDELCDGVELFYTELSGLAAKDIIALTRTREELAAFSNDRAPSLN